MTHLHTASDWFPLSSAQRSRWFLYQLEAQSQGTHNNSFAVRLHDAVEVASIEDALNRLVARHPMLRARFRTMHGEPEQCIAAQATVQVSVRSAQSWPDSALQLEVAADRLAPFDLTQGPLVRAHVYRTAARETVLLLVFDHLVCDGWSYWQMLGELGQLLADPAHAGAAGGTHAYRDYIEWQRSWVDSTAGQSQWRHWQSTLGADLPSLQLPSDRPFREEVKRQEASLSVSCSAEQTAQLRALAKQESSSLFVVLLTAYHIVLQRHTGQDDIVIGTPMPGRSQPQWNGVVGDFVNPIAIRCAVEGKLSVKQLLRQMRSSVFKGMQNQEYPFDLLVEKLLPTRHAGVAPIFQTMFTLQKARHAKDLLGLWHDENERKVQWGGYAASAFPVRHSGGGHNHGLALEAIELNDSLRFDLRYDAALFDASRIERFATHFQNVLRALAVNVDVPVASLALLGANERCYLLEELNDTRAEWEGSSLLHQRFESQAARRPAAPALSYGAQSLSYDELNRRANQLAHRLIGLGMQPDKRVAICVERGVDMIVALLATLKAGGAYVPLDPAYPAERLAFMLADSAPAAVITHAALAARLPGADALRLLVLDDPAVQATLAGQATHNPDPQALGLTPEHLAYVIYTSGSTGQPKGVMNAHRGICNFGAAQAALFEVTPASRVLQFASLSFDASLMEITMAYCAGASLHLASREDLLPGAPLVEMLRSRAITHTLLPASALAACGAPEQLAPMTVILGGDVLPAALARQWAQRHRVFNAYGPTEAAICAATFRCHTELDDTVPIGRPVPNAAIYLLDAHGQPVPQGVVGEIHIGGAGVARGYLNRPELTAERFVADPFAVQPGARMYKTGDLGRWLADGTLAYLGRNDFQVKIRGFRIELGEIEARLQACDGVSEALVVARVDRGGENRLVAYVVADPERPTALALRTALQASLAEYMVPQAFVLLDAFPLTSNGKVDRKALPEPDAEAVAAREYVAPQGPVETAIGAIWADLLGLERVSRHDNFFDLGGHSLLAVQVAGRLADQFNVEITLKNLFEFPTLLELAAVATDLQLSQYSKDDMQDLDQELENLSESELLAMLGKGTDHA
jgi:amino acid adenylation domain-containing protein